MLVIAVLTQILLNCLIDTLGLPICLGTECSALSQAHIEPLHQLSPESAGEHRIPIRNNIARESMQSPDIRQEELGTSLRGLLLILNRDKMGHFRETVNHYPNRGAAIRRWKLGDEVHGYRIPCSIGQLKRVQCAMLL